MKSNKNKELSDYEIQCSKENQSSFENSYCVKKEKKIKLKLKKERIYKQKTHGPWTKEEQQKFMNYIRSNLQVFESKNLRRRNKVFRQMAKYLKTRSSEQCRSHHQKYEQRFQTSHKIISYLEKKFILTEQNNSLNFKGYSCFSDEQDNSQQKHSRNISKPMSILSKDERDKNEKKTGIPIEQYTLLLEKKHQYKIFQKMCEKIQINFNFDDVKNICQKFSQHIYIDIVNQIIKQAWQAGQNIPNHSLLLN